MRPGICVTAAPRRCAERRPLPPRLHARRRHRRRQGPPVGRHHPRQLAAGSAQGGLDLEVRQADRGRAARLVGARHGAPAGHAALALPARQADHAGRRRPIFNLRHAAVRRPRREGFARPADRRLVGLRFRRSDHFRREPRHAERRRRQGRTRRCRPLAAGTRRACACSTRCPTPASSMSRRPAPPRSTISPTPSGSASGAARISPSPPAPNSSRRSRMAVSPPWRCWPAICARSASTPPARSPMTASNTNWSSTRSPTSSGASTTPMPAPSRSSTTTSTRRWRPPTSPARAAR